MPYPWAEGYDALGATEADKVKNTGVPKIVVQTEIVDFATWIQDLATENAFSYHTSQHGFRISRAVAGGHVTLRYKTKHTDKWSDPLFLFPDARALHLEYPRLVKPRGLEEMLPSGRGAGQTTEGKGLVAHISRLEQNGALNEVYVTCLTDYGFVILRT
jgi:hypothetical protein